MNPRSALTEKYMQKLDLGFYPWVCDICINPNDGCGVFYVFFFVLSVFLLPPQTERVLLFGAKAGPWMFFV